MNKIISALYKLARQLTDIKALSSGSPVKIINRIINKLIGRKIIKRLYRK